jgi:membrane fusion protein (multidrug efflux system)
MKTSTIFNVCIVLLLLTSLTACSTHKETVEKTPVPQGAKLIVLHKNALQENIRIPGELKAFEEVDLYAKLNSFVKQVLVDRGSIVKEGQELVLLDAPELDAQYQEALQKLRTRQTISGSSTSYFKRLLLTSHTPGTVSQNDLEQAESKMMGDSSEVSSAQAGFQAVSDLKNYLIVKAPFSGIISERNISPGAFVGTSGKGTELPMLKLVQEGKLRLVVAVPEVQVGGLSPNAWVRFQVKAFPSDTFRAQIVRIAGNLDLKTRSELIEMDVENKDHRLLPGMYAEVEIGIRRSEPAFVVPLSALFTNTEGVFVIRVRNAKAERIAVRKGNMQEGKIEIFGPLTENDSLLEQASDQIRDGQDI